MDPRRGYLCWVPNCADELPASLHGFFDRSPALSSGTLFPLSARIPRLPAPVHRCLPDNERGTRREVVMRAYEPLLHASVRS